MDCKSICTAPSTGFTSSKCEVCKSAGKTQHGVIFEKFVCKYFIC